MLRGTVLATALFVLVSTVLWWLRLDWEEARRHLPWTVFASPAIWLATVGWHRRPRLVHAIGAGALTGLLTQLVMPHFSAICGLFSNRGTGDGEVQLAAIAIAGVFFVIGSVALLLGAIIGLLTTSIERRMSAHSGRTAA
jgi:hypothetical protein